MTFPKALLLSAVLASLSGSLAAPTPSCTINSGFYGQLSLGQNIAISTSSDQELVVGGKPQIFALAQCGKGQNEDPKGYDVDYVGYIADGFDTSKCVTASQLDASGATFSLQPCQFDSTGKISDKQSFAWRESYTGPNRNVPIFFNGEHSGYVNVSNPTPYNLAPADGSLGNLQASYNTANPVSQSSLTFTGTDGSNGPGPQVTCSSYKTGQFHFSNGTYDGPLNAKLEAEQGTTDSFLFEQCSSSYMGYTSSDAKIYGRMRPSTDASNGQYNCLVLQDSGLGYDQNTFAPTDKEWVNGYFTQQCSDVDDYHQRTQFFELDTQTNQLTTVRFTQEQNAPGQFLWYTQLDYDREFNVSQYVWDPHGVGVAYLDPNSDLVKEYPPATVTFA